MPESDNSAEVVRPASVEELSALLRESGGTVRVLGGGTKWSWGAAGIDPNLVVEMAALDRVVEHAAGDLVVTAQAGTRLADLQTVLGVAGQWLALDPPEPGATVGGVVATAASGPRRLRYGTPRDLLIGITVVLADGTVARSGGKVVKNVAGYDLGKLFTGSFGTLGVIAECTLRLHPGAPARRVVSITTDQPGPLVREVLRSPLEPTALQYDGDTLLALFDAVEPAARAQADALVAMAGAGDAVVADAVPAGFADRPWHPGDVALKVTHRISALGPAIDAVRRRVPGSRMRAYAGSGLVEVGWRAQAAEVAPAVAALRDDVAALDGTVVVVDAPADVKQTLDVWGPVRGFDIMRRVKSQFDPSNRMSPGRFVGGI